MNEEQMCTVSLSCQDTLNALSTSADSSPHQYSHFPAACDKGLKSQKLLRIRRLQFNTNFPTKCFSNTGTSSFSISIQLQPRSIQPLPKSSTWETIPALHNSLHYTLKSLRRRRSAPPARLIFPTALNCNPSCCWQFELLVYKAADK